MTILDKPEVLAVISDKDPWFLESGLAVGALSGLFVWEAPTTVTMTQKWLDELKTTTRISWTSTDPDPRFWVYFNGQLKFQDSEVTFLDVTVQGKDSFILQVFDSINHSPQAAFPTRFTVGWFHVPGTAEYDVEELVSAVWTRRALITDRGEGFFQFISRALENDTVHQLRITPIGTNGNAGTILSFSARMVRVPDPPIATIVYDGAGPKTVTITVT